MLHEHISIFKCCRLWLYLIKLVEIKNINNHLNQFITGKNNTLFLMFYPPYFIMAWWVQ